LRVDHLGDALEYDRGAGERSGALFAGTTDTRPAMASGVMFGEQAEPRETRQRFVDFAERLGLSVANSRRRPRLDVDHRDAVAGIGERHRDAAPMRPAPSSDGRMSDHQRNPSRSSACKPLRSRRRAPGFAASARSA